ncbi:MAG: GNAT family N-acetyltransferase [Crocinitomicaceae bacterium]|nr:GNAT family N-acetyltransferase [Crocinitomicaceae bacterium]
MIEIVQLNKDDVFIVNHLAHDIWPIAFRDILTKDQIDYMLDWMYNVNTLQEQAQIGHLFYIIKEHGVAKGFVGLEPNFPDAEMLRIHKLYVLPECQNKGFGRLLLNKAIDIAFDIDLHTLHLNVNRFTKSVDFYRHCGFKVIGEEDIDIGRDYLMEDFIMELQLDTGTSKN